MDDVLLAELTSEVHSATEARWILERADQIAEGARIAPVARSMAARRAGGEPLQYVLGTWSFRNLELKVDERALIPRPETEQVVDAALERWRRTRPGDGALCIVELGCGTGAIALSLISELRGETRFGECVMTDVSSETLRLAGENAMALGAAGVTLRLGNWFGALSEGLHGSIDILISNPPYVAESQRGHLDPVIDWEPDIALYAPQSREGVEGFAHVETLITQARTWLSPGGVLCLEMSEDHVAIAMALAEEVGLVGVEEIRDLAGMPRGMTAVAP
jgi:release factor glutamine methyltransferase